MDYNICSNILLFFKKDLAFTASFFMAILGIILSVYFYIKAKKKKRPTYIVKTNNLVKESVQRIRSIQILYEDKTIANLSATKILFWNDGNETIDHTDVAKTNPIKITIDQKYEILEADILYSKNKDNNFKQQLSDNKKSVRIKFDYINANEGIIIQLFHTGFSSDDIRIEGGVKSVKRIKRKELNQTFLPLSLRYLKKSFDINIRGSFFIITLGYTVLIVGAIMCLLGILYSNLLCPYPDPKHLSLNEYKILYNHDFITSRVVIISGGAIYIYLGWRWIRRKIPKGFNMFYQ
ncbi:MAG: hypothetical protein GX416_11535 [Bacteroidales bacterium]|nr:hypothetical protein [Bacteroidales bacterium]